MNDLPTALTISRQLGSGGAFLGRQLADELGMLYLDRDIVIKSARELNVLEAEIECRDEKKTSFWNSMLQSLATHPSGMRYVPPEMHIPSDVDLYKTESEIIRNIARRQSVVIIGRGGYYLLRDHPRHFSVLLHADPPFRQKRIEELYHVTAADAKNWIEKSDRERADYLRELTGRNWTDARQFHLSINTGMITFEQAKKMILACVRSRFGAFSHLG